MAGKVTETNATSTRTESSRPSGGSRPTAGQRHKDGGLIARFRHYLHEVVVELKKTTWPKKPELINSTKVVLSTVLFVGIYLALVDWGLTQVTRFLGFWR